MAQVTLPGFFLTPPLAEWIDRVASHSALMSRIVCRAWGRQSVLVDGKSINEMRFRAVSNLLVSAFSRSTSLRTCARNGVDLAERISFPTSDASCRSAFSNPRVPILSATEANDGASSSICIPLGRLAHAAISTTPNKPGYRGVTPFYYCVDFDQTSVS